jgi:hypothetical protein
MPVVTSLASMAAVAVDSAEERCVGWMSSAVSRGDLDRSWRDCLFLASAAFVMMDLVMLAETTDLVCVAEGAGVTTTALPLVGTETLDGDCFVYILLPLYLSA